MPRWYDSRANLLRLFDHLIQTDQLERDPTAFSRFLEKPWKYSAEWAQLETQPTGRL